jgi:hypothetical protein
VKDVFAHAAPAILKVFRGALIAAALVLPAFLPAPRGGGHDGAVIGRVAAYAVEMGKAGEAGENFVGRMTKATPEETSADKKAED